MYVALNKVCMTHGTRGLRQSKQLPLSSYLLQFSPFLSHFFTITSFHPFMFTLPLSEALSHVSLQQIIIVMVQCYEGAVVAYG